MLEVAPDPAVTAATGLFVLVLGYLVRFREWTFLVAGYDRVSGPASPVVADVVGSMVLRVGVATFALAGVMAAGLWEPVLGQVYEVAVVLAVARTIYRLHAYSSGEDAAVA